MRTNKTTLKAKTLGLSSFESQTEEFNQKKLLHAENAEMHHVNALHYLNERNYHKASQSALLAQNSVLLMNEVQKEVLINPPFYNDEPIC